MNPSHNDSTIYLCAPVNALVEGIYEQRVTIGEVKEHGDFGLGTFNDLDGEMVMMDGMVYQVDSRGIVNSVGDDALTPFACVTFHKPLTLEDIPHEMDYGAFLELVGRLLPSPNLFYALRIEGRFSHVKTRSVPRQENYRPLVDVARDQTTFDLHNVEGTLAGFYTPAFMSSLNVPGLHLHFLTHDLKHGGHLLECRPTAGRAGIQFISKLELSLPMSLDYLTLDFERNVVKDLEQVER
jgi:acetolactate decarboxylase